MCGLKKGSHCKSCRKKIKLLFSFLTACWLPLPSSCCLIPCQHPGETSAMSGSLQRTKRPKHPRHFTFRRVLFYPSGRAKIAAHLTLIDWGICDIKITFFQEFTMRHQIRQPTSYLPNGFLGLLEIFLLWTVWYLLQYGLFLLPYPLVKSP